MIASGCSPDLLKARWFESITPDVVSMQYDSGSHVNCCSGFGYGNMRLTVPTCVSEAKLVTRTDVARVITSSRLVGHPFSLLGETPFGEMPNRTDMKNNS